LKKIVKERESISKLDLVSINYQKDKILSNNKLQVIIFQQLLALSLFWNPFKFSFGEGSSIYYFIILSSFKSL